MGTPWTGKQSTFISSGITFWWFLISVIIGLVAIVIFGIIEGGILAIRNPQKWGATLFVGMLLFFYMISVKDKKRFFLATLVFAMILAYSKTLMFIASPVFRSNYGFTIPLFLPSLVMLYVIWGFRCIIQRSPPDISTSGLWAYAGLFATAVISTVLHNRLYGMFDLFAMMISLLLFIYAASEISERRFRFVIVMLIVITVIEGGIAIAQNLTGSTLGLEVFGARQSIKGYLGIMTLARVTGTFGHPSGLAAFFDLTLPLGVSMVFYPMRRSLKFLLLLGMVVSFLGLGMTYARGGIIASLVFSGIILLINLVKRFGMTKGIFTAVAFSTIFTLLILTVPNPLAKGLHRTEAETAYGRIVLMDVAFNMIRENLWFGVGLNNYVPVALHYDFTPQQLTRGWDTAVHNVYLYVAGEIGIIGLMFFIAIMVSVFIAFLPAVRSSDPLIFYGGLGIYGGVAAHLFHWFTDLAPWTSSFMFWFMMGLAVTAGRLAKSTVIEPQKEPIKP
jgi:O-antigen ligase